MSNAEHVCLYRSPLGAIRLTARDGALVSARFTDDADGTLDVSKPDDPVLLEAAAWLDRFFDGCDPGPVPPCKPAGTPFQTAVWDALLSIPYGETVSYGDLARRIGLDARHARAIGGAVGKNPLALFYPCHRVVGKTGELTGYAYGLERKKNLLELEQRKGAAMEEQIIRITIRSKGERCELSDAELKAWYEQKIAAFFDPKLGMPEINVDVERKQL